MIYIIVLVLMLAAVYAFDMRGHKQFYSVAFWGFFVLLVMIAGLRYRIGTDSIVYENTYEASPTFYQLENFKFDSTRYEPGFMVAISITRALSPDFVWFQFFESIIINLVIFNFILKNTRNRFLCLTFYYIILYLTLNTQVLREAFAVACFLLAWPFFRDGKWIPYYLLTVLACFFHTSATVTLLFPLFCLPGIRELFVLGKRTIVICLAIVVVGVYIEANFSNLLSLLALTERMVDRVNVYSKNQFGTSLLNIMGIIGTALQFCLYPLLAIYFSNQYFKYRKRKLKSEMREAENEDSQNKIAYEIKVEKKEEKKYDRWQTMVLLGVYFVLLSTTVFIFGRYFNYVGIFCMATVANCAFHPIVAKGKKYRIAPSMWALVLLPYFIFNFMPYTAAANKSGTLKAYMIFYPYSSRLDPQTDNHREDLYRYLDAR